MDCGVAADVATVFGILVALGVSWWEIRSNRRERRYGVFLRLLEAYESIQVTRRDCWSRIKKTLAAKPALAPEMHDGQHSLGYLQIRMKQPEAFFAVEHQLLELEARSGNVLNELCRIAKNDEATRCILTALLGSEISYYKVNIGLLKTILDSQKTVYRFPMVNHWALNAYDISHSYPEPQDSTSQ